MYPASFDYVAPTSLEEAISLLDVPPHSLQHLVCFFFVPLITRILEACSRHSNTSERTPQFVRNICCQFFAHAHHPLHRLCHCVEGRGKSSDLVSFRYFSPCGQIPTRDTEGGFLEAVQRFGDTQ